MSGLLTLLIFIPLAGAIVIMLVGRERDEFSRVFALLVSLVTFALSIGLYTGFRADTPKMQFVEKVPWVEEMGISYSVGIDGISLLLVLLTTLLTALAILSSWTAITSRVREYMASMLLLETGMLGVFCSLDLFLFYVFWEAMLIPMYLLIGIWGGERRIYAAIKFVLFTLAGSLLMLVAIIYLYFLHGGETGTYTFDLLTLYRFSVARDAQYWLFLAFFLSFAIKVPLFPFHLFTHAFFKGLMFLAAGSVMHAMADELDMRKMGGLLSKMKITGVTFWIGALAIAGVPPLSGFWSKDEILVSAYRSGHTAIWALGVVGAAMTAFYMFR